jgi:hypothetical protein
MNSRGWLGLSLIALGACGLLSADLIANVGITAEEDPAYEYVVVAPQEYVANAALPTLF